MFGALVALLVAADAISGERERGTLESLLLTPAPRRHLVSGKLLAALSLWFAALIVAVPYVWFLGRDVGAVDDALVAGLLVGTLVAVSLTAFGLIVSVLASTNRVSLSVSLFVLLALFAPTLLPGGRQAGLGRRAAAAREPDDRRRALHAQRRDQPVRLDEGAVLARLPDRGERRCSRSSRSSSCRASCRCAEARRDERRRRPLLVCLVCVLVVAAPAERCHVLRSRSPSAARRSRRGSARASASAPRSGTRARRPLSGLVAHLNVVGLEHRHLRRSRGLVRGADEERRVPGPRRVDRRHLERDGGHRRRGRDLRRGAAG